MKNLRKNESVPVLFTTSISILFTLILALTAINAVHAAPVTANITVGSSPIGVAYDSGKNEVFVANAGGKVSIISDKTNTVVANVTGILGHLGLVEPFEMAYDPSKNEMFISIYNIPTQSSPV